MSSTIKRLLGQFDLFLGYITSALMHVFLYVFTVVFFLLSLFSIISGPFEETFSFDELDNFELLVFAAFIFVTVRFFKRSKSAGHSVWLRLRRYVFVSALISVFYMAVTAVVLMGVLEDRGEIGVSDLYTFDDLQYFSFCILYLIALYAFTPLPKIAWFQGVKGDLNEEMKNAEEKENRKSTEQQADFFTDSAGNTRADSMNTDNKQ